MALPPSLVASTTPIVEKALETGARGSTTTQTNYGVIGDAFFQKARLDMNIAELKANLGVQEARVKADTAMQMANLHQNEANLKMNWLDQDRSYKLEREKFDWQKAQAEKANEASDSEKIFGSLSGAVSGGLSGFMLGGPAGAAIGAVAGAGLTYAGAQTGGRTGMQSALGFVQTASQAAVAFKDYNQKEQSKEAWGAIAKTGSDIISRMGSPNAQVAAQAQQEWAAHRTAVTSQMAADGYNPQQIAAGWKEYEGAMRTGMASMDPKEAGQARIMQAQVMAQTDPRRNGTPAQQRALIKESRDMANMGFVQASGYDADIPGAPVDFFRNSILGSKSNLAKTFDEMQGGLPRGSYAQSPNNAVTKNPTVSNSVGGPSVGQATVQAQEAVAPVGTQVGVAMASPGPSAAIPYRPPNIPAGPAIEMHDGGAIDATPEGAANLSELGAQSAETLKKYAPDEAGDSKKYEGIGDRILHGGKVGGVPVPGLLTQRGVAQDEAFEKDAHQKAAYEKGGIQSASHVKEEVNSLIGDIETKTDTGKNKKQGIMNGVYYAEKVEKAINKLPDGYFGEIASRAHAEGLKSTDYAAAIVTIGTGVKGKALVTALKAAGGKGALQAAAAMGILKATDVTSKIDADVIQPMTKGKGIMLSDEQAKAVTEFADGVREMAYASLQAEFGKVPRLEDVKVETSQLLNLSDSNEAKWDKFVGYLNDMKDSANVYRKTYGGGGGTATKAKAPTAAAIKEAAKQRRYIYNF